MNLPLAERVLGIAGLVTVLALVPFIGSDRERPVAPAPVEVATPVPADPQALGRPPAPDGSRMATTSCPTGGNDGRRIEALYVHTPQKNRFGVMEKTFQQWLERGDQAFVEAAKRTGGGVRRLRLLRDPQCRIVIRDVTVATEAFKDVDQLTAALQAQGYRREDRKYVVWYDAPGCGLAFGIGGNDRPDWYNLYNFGPHYATLGTDCWSWPSTTHELLHTLGAVQLSAPHASKNGHCWDEQDIMCEDDRGLPKHGLKTVCRPSPRAPAAVVVHQIDCQGDDYFSTRPAPGSYLDTHWNVADNEFLFRQ